MKKIPVIGIGASAGGLKEFERFFKHMPAGKELAFVLIQHLAPDHKSILAEIVKRYTEMDVFQVKDKIKVEAGKVYIIPPNNLLTIANGKLLLSPMRKNQGRYLPIDIFFRSLKDSLGEKAIAVILSGTGSDGTLGIKEVKEAGGLTIVQKPETADYNGMPINAIKTGLIDFIIPVEEMPNAILSYIENEIQENRTIKLVDAKADGSINQIFNLIKKQIGQDFTNYKRNTVLRRIEHRLTVNKFDNLKDYIDLLKANPKEIGTLYKELLISVTSFFRDAETFKFVEKNLIPKIVAQAENQKVRIWVPACATGEEAYSWAMLFQAYIDDNKLNHEIQIFASDIDAEAVERAREGYYTNNIVADVSSELLERFFIKEKEGYKVEKSIRESVIFADQNLIQDPPYSRLDMVSCRNFLIYLDNELQQKAISIFHYALKPHCTLVLGNSESLGNSAQYFKVVDRKFKIFTKIDNIDVKNRVWKMNYQRLENNTLAKKAATESIAALTKEFVLDRYTPPSVVIDYDGEMLYVQGKTGKYLELSTGEVKNNIVKVAREGLKVPLMNIIRKVKTINEEIVHKNIRVKTNGDFEYINLSISPFIKNNKDIGLLIVIFEPTLMIPQISGDNIESHADVTIHELEKELAEKEQYLQNAIEELETINEELKSSNEDSQSTNEELQSTNEELETSKEELQSVNEELSATNNELTLKIDELAKVNNNLKNLLDATNIATIFLDRNMKIFNFTPAVSEIINLLHTDIGRSIQQFTNNLDYDNLIEDSKFVLETLIPKEKEVYLANKNYFWMRIIPYLTTENVVEGVVITFTNITEKKKQEAELEKYSQHLEELVEEKSKKLKESEALLNETEKTAKIGGWTFDLKTLKQTWTEEVYRIHEVDLTFENSVDNGIEFYAPTSRPIIEKAVTEAIEEGKPYDLELEIITAKGNKKWVNVICKPKMKDGKVVSISGSFQDITSEKLAEEELRKRTQELIANKEIHERTEKIAHVGSWDWDVASDTVTWSDELFQIFRWNPEKGAVSYAEHSKIYTADSMQRLDQAVQHTLETGEPFEIDLEIIRSDGTNAFCATQGLAKKDKNGNVIQLFGFLQDITERKITEEALKKNRELLSYTEKLGKVGGWEINIDTLDMTWTEEVYNIHEVEIKSKQDIEKGIIFYTPESRPLIEKAVQRAIELGEPFDLELEIITAKGNRRNVHSIGKADFEHRRVFGFFQDITERKQMVSEVKKERDNAQLYIDIAGVMIMVLNKQGEIEIINKKGCEILGYSNADELIGSNWFDVCLSREMKDEVYSVFKQLMIGEGELFEYYENHVLTKSGNERIIAFHNTVLFNSDSKSTGILFSGDDITERKQSEIELKKAKERAEESEIKFKAAFYTSPDSVNINNMNGEYIEINEGFTRLTGYTEDDIIGKLSSEINIWSIPNDRKKLLVKLRKFGIIENLESIFKTKDGRLIPALMSAKIITLKNEPYILSFTKAISERKKFERDLITAKEKAEESEMKLIEAQELSHVGSWEYFVETDIVLWSKELHNIFEHPYDLPAPKYSEQQKYYTKESFALLDKALQECVKRETPYEIELDIITSSGSAKHIILKGKVKKDKNNKIIGSYGTAQDVTQKKKIEKDLIEAKEKAEEADRLKSAFLANMSHEIRTPMNGILGFTSLLQRPNLSGEEQQEYISIIQKSGDRLLNTVNDIIDISKIESGHVELSVSEVNIYEQLKYLHSFFKIEAAKKGIQLAFKNHMSEQDFILKTDFEKFNSIVTNLVKNAIKFTNQGKIELGYNLKKKMGSTEVAFYVKDTGIGISKERQKAIFERFVQADIGDTRVFEGSGLGLSISKAYVEMLGGKIWLESEDGIGSTFYFSLPYNAEPEENRLVGKVNSKQNEKNRINPEISGLKILIVEDDETSEKLIKIAVEQFAKEILIARNGLDAVESCRKNPDIDLVLMDIQLPEVNGYEATRQIRHFNKEVVIIAQTAYALSGDREKAIEDGCDDYIPKPINKNQLLSLMQKYFK